MGKPTPTYIALVLVDILAGPGKESAEVVQRIRGEALVSLWAELTLGARATEREDPARRLALRR
jgi:hypothetical protein